jgi:type I restriction enzyme S subunit
LEALVDQSGGNVKTLQSEYRESGAFPIVDQGKDLVGGYTDDPTSLCRSQPPVLVFGDHTRALKYVDFPFGMGADGVKVLHVRDGFDPKFVFHYLRSLDIPSAGYSRHFKFLKERAVPRPPLEEQRKIAAILDQADALRARRREALAHLDDLNHSIFLDMFGDPVTNVRGWESLPLTDVCYAHSGGTPSMSQPSNWVGSLPWFSPKDMKRNDLFDSLDHISEAIPRTTNLRLLPPETVAIVVRGMILAHTFPVCVLRVPATINQDMKALLPRRFIETQFLAACLRAQARHVLSQVSTAAHGTKRLDAEGLRAIPIILPDATLQQDFVARLTGLEVMRTAQEGHLAIVDSLFASLQSRAFAGDL